MNNGQFASGSSDKTIKIWSSTNGDLITTINAHEGGVRSLSLTDDGKLISGAEDKLVKIWEIGSWNCVNTLGGHDDYVRMVYGLAN